MPSLILPPTLTNRHEKDDNSHKTRSTRKQTKTPIFNLPELTMNYHPPTVSAELDSEISRYNILSTSPSSPFFRSWPLTPSRLLLHHLARQDLQHRGGSLLHLPYARSPAVSSKVDRRRQMHSQGWVQEHQRRSTGWTALLAAETCRVEG